MHKVGFGLAAMPYDNAKRGVELGALPEPIGVPLNTIDEILANLPLANIAFNVPATLHSGHSAVIQLFLSMQHSIEQLQARISALGER